MEAETELHRRDNVLVRGTTNSKIGTAILTNERLLFFDEKFMSAGGGLIEDLIVDALQKRHEAGGPLLDLPLASITGITREKKFFNKDRIRISAGGEDYLFNEGWPDLSRLLLDTLRSQYGRRTVQEATDAWRIEPA